MLTNAVIADALMPAVNQEINGLLSTDSLEHVLGMMFYATDEEEQEALRLYGDFRPEAIAASWKLPMTFHNLVLWNELLIPTDQYVDRLTHWFKAEKRIIIREDVKQLADGLNQLVFEKTAKMIRLDIKPDMLVDTVVMWMNITLLISQWVDGFDPNLTCRGVFGAQRVMVDYMQAVDDFNYAEDDICQSLRKPLKNGYMAHIVLPKKDFELSDMLTMLDTICSMEHSCRNVALTLPKLDISGKTDCNALLELWRIKLPAFDTGACPVTIHQLAKLQLDEQGVKAAAVTMGLVAIGYAPPPLTMDVNRPFLLLIEEANGTIKFAGAVQNPIG